MRNSNEKCQGLGSMHLGLSLSLLFLSQTEATRTRFWILSTSFSKYVDCQKNLTDFYLTSTTSTSPAIWVWQNWAKALPRQWQTQSSGACPSSPSTSSHVQAVLFLHFQDEPGQFGWDGESPCWWDDCQHCEQVEDFGFFFRVHIYISGLKISCYLPSSDFFLLKEMYDIDAANVKTKLKPASIRVDFFAR